MQKAYMEWAGIADMWMGFDLVSDSGGHRSGVRIVANDWQTDYHNLWYTFLTDQEEMVVGAKQEMEQMASHPNTK